MRVEYGALFVPASERRAYDVQVGRAVADVLAEAVVLVVVQIDQEFLVV